ncbi:sugar phosphate isomerase/epimerase family protein [Oleiharenicola lentus]|nr:sugar phosphate isomerase/epimerase [Oleiharenicola lentus]
MTACSPSSGLPRREFIRLTAMAAASSLACSLRAASPGAGGNVPLGMDAYSLRAYKWPASRLIAYAAEQRLDAVLFNGLKAFERLDDAYLTGLRQAAASAGIRLYVGIGSVTPGSTTFLKDYGSVDDLLTLGVRVATALGSSVVNCRIGNLADRSTPGGIEARMAELIHALRSVRTRAQDAGLKFAVENHAADLRTEEMLQVIQAAGADTTGVMLDPGNALWAMEDPMRQLEQLGRYVACTSIRDYMVWPTPEGAMFQWTAVGEGLMDVPAYVATMARLCPDVPLLLETISNSPRPIPYLQPDYWKVYPAVRAADIVEFLALCRRGHAIPTVQAPAGADPEAFEQEYQRGELERSLAYLRAHGPAGRKS